MRWRREYGQAALLMAVTLAFLAVVGLFAANVGVLVATKVAVQRAADAAVLAGCAELPNRSAAQNTAVEYGQTRNSGPHASHLESGNTVTFPSPQPPSGPFTNDTFQVEVRRATSLLGPITLTGDGVSARATCRRDEGPRPALQALGQGQGRMRLYAGASVHLGGTGAVVASTDACGLIVEFGATLQGRFFDTPTGASGCIVGAIDPPVQPVPDTSLLTDPFVSVLEPQLNGTVDLPPYTLTVPGDLTANDPRPGCEGTFQGPRNETSPARPNHCHITVSTTLEPGIYWGGLQIGDFSGGSAITVYLNPGLYFLAGGVGGEQNQGGLWVGANTTVVGDGVVFFSGGDPYALSAGFCGRLLIEPGARFDVTPPTTGAYAGILFFQARDCLESVVIESATIGRQAGPKGALYLPRATVTFSGTNTLYAILVADGILIRDTLMAEVMIGSGTLWHGPVRLIE